VFENEIKKTKLYESKHYSLSSTSNKLIYSWTINRLENALSNWEMFDCDYKFLSIHDRRHFFA